MKRGVRSKKTSFLGAFLFFILIAFIIQVAVLVYDYISKQTDNNLIIAVVILGVIVLLSTFCTIFDVVRRRITVYRPVDRILDATERISKGDFSVRIKIKKEYGKHNEYDAIMANINLLASELSKTEVLRTDFISNVSHEIKTPLAIIQNYATLLGDKNVADEDREKYLSAIVQATKRLSDLTSNMLKLNKLDNQQISPEIKKFNLTESLSQSVLAYEDAIESKNLLLDCDLDDVYIESNESMLELVWNNLVSNAIKFTDEGSIKVTLKKDGCKAIVSVKDSGIGIDSKTGERIFEKFYQGETSRAGQGNGLGLALVKKVIDKLGGQILVESEKGKGSEFTVILNGAINE